MVQLLLGTVGVRAAGAERTALCICQARVLLVPERAELMAITDAGRSTGVLVGVGVHTGLPVMLRPDGTPHGLELLCEELVSHCGRHVALLFRREERSCDFFSAVREGAILAVPTTRDVRPSRAKSVLLLWLRSRHDSGASPPGICWHTSASASHGPTVAEPGGWDEGGTLVPSLRTIATELHCWGRAMLLKGLKSVSVCVCVAATAAVCCLLLVAVADLFCVLKGSCCCLQV
mmetsp:Transcript_30076/g.64976  ORF Transcript_30076/g.64976 Transcript_30076/m.64976 type:complete len:233 (+) Transcript_30076:916-1614(+)